SPDPRPPRPAVLTRDCRGRRSEPAAHPAGDLGHRSLGDLPRRTGGLVRRSRRGGAPGNPVAPRAGSHPPLPAGITSPVPAGSASGWGRRGAARRAPHTSHRDEREGNVDRAQHVPVMAGRVTALLAPALAAEGAVLVDATLG